MYYYLMFCYVNGNEERLVTLIYYIFDFFFSYYKFFNVSSTQSNILWFDKEGAPH